MNHILMKKPKKVCIDTFRLEKSQINLILKGNIENITLFSLLFLIMKEKGAKLVLSCFLSEQRVRISRPRMGENIHLYTKTS